MGLLFQGTSNEQAEVKETPDLVETVERIYTGVHRIYTPRLAEITLQEL